MSGSSTLSYRLLGLGPPPYPREKLVTQGNTSALVYFKGASIEAAEYLGTLPNASLNPLGLVRIENGSLYLDTNDLLVFSAVVINTSPEAMTPIVRIAGSGLFGSNSTSNGITWIGAGPVICAKSLAPNSQCTASLEPLSRSSGNATQFHFMVEVIGKVGAQWFLYQQRFVIANPNTGQGVNAEWVAAFMRAVNSARNGTSLQETKSLDDFAQIRFKTSISNFTIANYGFTKDYDHFFTLAGPPGRRDDSVSWEVPPGTVRRRSQAVGSGPLVYPRGPKVHNLRLFRGREPHGCGTGAMHRHRIP
jgi:hypothetical protein